MPQAHGSSFHHRPPPGNKPSDENSPSKNATTASAIAPKAATRSSSTYSVYTKLDNTQPGSKTIGTKDATYHRLARLQGPDESFSDGIDRLIGHDESDRPPLAELIGLLDDDEVTAWRERTRAFRSEVDSRVGDESDGT